METIQYEVSGGVGTLTLNRPQRKNAIDAVMREELKEVVASMPRQRDLRALIITGAGATSLSLPQLKARPMVRDLVWRSRQISYWLRQAVGFACRL